MHPHLQAVLLWSNSQARNKRLRKLAKSTDIPKSDVVDATRVIEIRKRLFDARNSRTRQDEVLKTLREEFNMSRKRFKELCKLACVCVADGRWYPDLRKRIKSSKYRIDRQTLKEYHNLKLCMHTTEH